MNKCPFCKSDNLIYLGSSHVKSFKGRKTEKIGRVYSVIQTSEICVEMYAQQFACTECGMICEKLDEKSIEEYKKNKQYFFN